MGQSAEREALIAETAIVYTRAARLLDPLRLRVWEEMGITFPQLRILFLVRHQPGRDLRSLAERLSIGTSAASQQVERLVDKGLITRTEDVEDRRRIQLALTDRGRDAVESISTASRDYLYGLFERLSEEQLQTLNGVLSGLLEEASALPPAQLAFEGQPATS